MSFEPVNGGAAAHRSPAPAPAPHGAGRIFRGPWHGGTAAAAVAVEEAGPEGEEEGEGRICEFISRQSAPSLPERAATRMRQSVATGEGTGVTRMLLASASPHAIFACAAPVANDTFSFVLGLKFAAAFLLPFVALPQFPWSPFRSGMLEMEREFVLSGAALRRDFSSPLLSLCVISTAFFCQVTAISFVAIRGKVGPPRSGHITVEELVIPCLLWLFLGAGGGAYHGYRRVAHALERLDRQLTPSLFAFAAGIVDTKTRGCIYTWDDKGRWMVRNKFYRYRWMTVAVIFGIIMGFAAPVTRCAFHQPLFGNGNGFEMAATTLTFFSTILFSTTITYYVLKLTDMQRQVLAQMRVLSRLAYLEGRSLLRPSECLNEKFNFDDPLNTADPFSGVVGWYMVRSLVLYASTCSNHSSRSLFMSFFVFCILCSFFLLGAEAVYFVAMNPDSKKMHYSARYSYGLVVCILWGFLLQRYLYSSVKTLLEHRRHLYLLDVAALYHLSPHPCTGNGASDIVTACRRMIDTHEQLPSIFSIRITPTVVVLIALVHFFALIAVWFLVSVEFVNR